MRLQLLSALLFLFLSAAQCETCQLPEIIPSSYSAFLVEFQLKCVNGLKEISLYADIGDKQFPVTKSAQGDKYQISWVAKSQIVPSQTIDVRVFDEDGFSKLKKGMREGDAADVKPLATIEIEHPGAAPTFPVKSEILALV